MKLSLFPRLWLTVAGFCLVFPQISKAQWVVVTPSAWSTNNSDVYFDAGRVGIGTSTPEAKLHMVGGDFWIYNNDNNPRVLVGDNANSGNWGSFQWDSQDNFLKIGVSSATDAITINNNGRVGIGTDSPSEALTVKGATGGAFQIALRDESDNILGGLYKKLGSPAAGEFYLYEAGGASGVGLSSTSNSWVLNNFGVGTNSPSAKLHVLPTVNGDGVLVMEPDGVTNPPIG